MNYSDLIKSNPTGLRSDITDIASMFKIALPYIYAIAGMLLLLMVIWGGFQLMLAQGDPKGIATARARIAGALIGLVIVLASYWIVQLLSLVLNLESIKSVFGI